MDGCSAREFCGAVLAPRDVVVRAPRALAAEDAEAAVKYTERANIIAVDLALKNVVFRPARQDGRVYVVAFSSRLAPRVWSWDMFAETLDELQRAHQAWRSCRARGVEWHAPAAWSFAQNAAKRVVGAVTLRASQLLSGGSTMHCVSSVHGAAAGYLRIAYHTTAPSPPDRPPPADTAADVDVARSLFGDGTTEGVPYSSAAVAGDVTDADVIRTSPAVGTISFPAFTGVVDAAYVRIAPIVRDGDGVPLPPEFTRVRVGPASVDGAGTCTPRASSSLARDFPVACTAAGPPSAGAARYHTGVADGGGGAGAAAPTSTPTPMPREEEYAIEVWADDGLGGGGGSDRAAAGRARGGKGKLNPLGLTGPPSMGTTTPSRRERPTASAPQCVVCLQVARPGKVRKSGYKCFECVGTPSTPLGRREGGYSDPPAPSSRGHDALSMLSSSGACEAVRMMAGPQLPGAAC